MKNSMKRTVLALALPLVLAWPAAGQEVPDAEIIHNARDGVVRLYGAGGPDSAFKKVAAVFTKETDIRVEDFESARNFQRDRFLCLKSTSDSRGCLDPDEHGVDQLFDIRVRKANLGSPVRQQEAVVQWAV